MVKPTHHNKQALFGWARKITTARQGITVAAIICLINLSVLYLTVSPSSVLAALLGVTLLCLSTLYVISLIVYINQTQDQTTPKASANIAASSGTITTTTEVKRDATDHTSLEIKATQGETDAFFEVAPTALILTDTNGIIVQANNMAHYLFGFPEHALLNQSIETLIPENVRDRHRNHRRSYINAKSNKAKVLKNSNIHGRKYNGDTFSAWVNLMPITLQNKDYIALSVQDTTEQRAFEQSLEKAKSRAEHASQSKSEFVANMSHEIRTPLNAVLGSAQLLEKTSPNAMQKQYIQMIRSAGESLLAVINDILDFSKIESGQLELVSTPFSLDEVAARVSIMMAMNIGEKPIIPVIDIDPNLPTHFQGDALRLQQVLINLVSNAIKFTQQGEVTLLIQAVNANTQTTEHTEKLPSNNGTEAHEHTLLHFCVRDTGIGIKPDQLDNLFKAFSQADTSITRRFGGTGLGLVISNRLIGLMGSEIQVNSTYGEGSTFHFTIGLAAAEQKTLSLPKALTDSSAEDKNILLIEAHDASSKSALSIMNAAHLKTIHYPSAEMYLNLVEQKKAPAKVDGAILNWESCQPKARLAQLLDTLRRENPALKLLFTCAGNQQEQALLEHGAVDYEKIMVKPLTRAATLEKLFSQDGNTQASIQQNTQPSLKAGIHVLLVEDTVLNQTIATQMLEDMNVTCDIANNGAEAISQFLSQRESYAVIFMDIQMPIMDGVTATQILRKEHNCTIPIIAMTAGVLKSEHQTYLDAGMDDLVAKPIDHKELYQSLAVYGDKHCQAPRPTTSTPTQDHSPQHQVSGTSADEPTKTPANSNTLSTTLPGFEGKRLEILINGKPERIATMCAALEKICNDASRRVEHCNALLAKDNFDALRFEIHSLKGLVANYGGMSLKPLFEVVESHCSKDDITAKKEADAIARALQQVNIALKSYIKDALNWCEMQARKSKTPQSTAPVKPIPVNADLLTSELRTQLLEALDCEAFDDIKYLLKDIERLGEKASHLAKQIDPYISRKDVDGIVNLLRTKTR